MKQRLVILKFGSSVLSSCSRLPAVVHEIYRAYREGNRVIVVVSAIGRHTDVLLDEAQRISNPVASDVALAQLLSTGELQSAALLTMALHRAGIPTELIDPTTAALILEGDRLDSTPFLLDIDTVHTKLVATPVLVLPGFIGRHELGGTALMGRGGSDLSAAFLADQLKAAECRLVKDVDGIYERDPATANVDASENPPHRYGTVTYEEALRVAEVLVQPKAIEYLQAKGNTARVSALLHEEATEVGTAVTSTADVTPPPPLKVLMVGLGEVGQGVYEHVQQLPEFFEVVGIHVRDPFKHAERGVPERLLDSDIGELMARPYDLVVDVSGDRNIAASAIEECLQSGCPAVTASKPLVADRGAVLAAIASQADTRFKYSAAVGGSAPMVETLKRAAAEGTVIRLRGVLNGTCNYVLDRMAAGVAFEEAVLEAQANGFAEADVARDLSGQDSEDKLRILSRLAFGEIYDGLSVFREGLQTVSLSAVQLATSRGQVIRLVASIDADGMARVAPQLLPGDDFLAGARREENRLVINSAAGHTWQIRGKGAGRWPTAEAVIADMLDIRARPAKVNDKKITCASLAGQGAERLPPLALNDRQRGDSGQHRC